jgi:hypothetical protein
MDIMMMAMLCGKERARDDWERVLQAAAGGCKIEDCEDNYSG